jgi:predicted CDP-diglyceride synthetase/phosphatidate cytidylyltransferase
MANNVYSILHILYLSIVNRVGLCHKSSLICKLITLTLFSVTNRYVTGKTLDYHKHRKLGRSKSDCDQRTFYLANIMLMC